jgi:hypothetical protein
MFGFAPYIFSSYRRRFSNGAVSATIFTTRAGDILNSLARIFAPCRFAEAAQFFDSSHFFLVIAVTQLLYEDQHQSVVDAVPAKA